MIEATGMVHAAAMATVHAAAFPDDPWTTDSFAVLLAQPGVHGLIDEQGGVLLFRVAADEAEILTIGVTARRQGVGRALLAAALARAKVLGAAAAFLEVAASNAAALGLYAAAGFKQVGVRARYYADGDDALVLRLAL